MLRKCKERSIKKEVAIVLLGRHCQHQQWRLLASQWVESLTLLNSAAYK